MSKRIVITGATSGLGKATAEQLAAAGARLVICSENEAALLKTLTAMGGESDRLSGLVADVTNPDQVEALATQAQLRYGGLDVWINNAGMAAPSGNGALVPMALGEQLINTNILGTYYGSVTAVRHFRNAGCAGRIINMTGRGDKGPVKNAALYSSSKAWLRNFTLALAMEEREHGIEIGTFNPGLTLTGITARPMILAGNEAQQMKGLRTILPLIGDPASEPARSLAALALQTAPIKKENRHRRLLPHVLLRLITGKRADIDVTAIEPRLVAPELSR
ncbi:SDR family NAD(P)-dependent oxidoreductase [Halioglobus maricola]|nr:SDR family NAD(P)-dependent oxidoreductase [Halioglobus maricola]